MQFVLSNPPAKAGSGGKKMAGKKGNIVKSLAARGGRKFMGLSVPIVEQGAATAAGLFATNLVAAKVASAAKMPFLNKWYGRVGVKIATAVLLKMLLHKVKPQWGNAALGGGLASAALSAARQFLPANSTALQGLAGDVAENFAAGFAGYGEGDGDLGNLQEAINSIEARLSGSDDWDNSAGAVAGMGMFGS